MTIPSHGRGHWFESSIAHPLKPAPGVGFIVATEPLSQCPMLNKLKHSIRLLLHYLKFGDVPVPQ